MNRLLLALAIAVSTALPAAADSGIAFLPQPGQRIHYRVVRTTQTLNGPQSTSADFDVVRRTATTLVIERKTVSGAPNLSVLKVAADGSLALAEDANGAAADADLADVLYAMNLALTVTRPDGASARNSWQATLPMASTPQAEIADVTLAPANVQGADFDFAGSAQAVGAAPARRSSVRSPLAAGGGADAGGFPGGAGGGGGGYPRGGIGGMPGGGGRSRSEGGGQAAPASNRNGVTTFVQIAGHVSAGSVSRLAITQTRTVTVATLPFFNVAIWSITATK